LTNCILCLDYLAKFDYYLFKWKFETEINIKPTSNETGAKKTNAANDNKAGEQANGKHAKWFMLLVIVLSFMAIIYHSNLVTLNLKKLNSTAIK
jgi:hypothetical protein